MPADAPSDHAPLPSYLLPTGAPLSARYIDPPLGLAPREHATLLSHPPSADDDLWHSLVQRNPRLHDAPILRVLRFDQADSRFDLSLGSYRGFALQEHRLAYSSTPATHAHPLDPSLLWLLGVKGFIIAHDRRNAPHLLIARRSPHTRIYGGLWESAPAGGVQPFAGPGPASAPIHFDLTPHLAATLRNEAHEELGLDLTAITPHPVVVVQDSIARSYDIFLRVDLTAPIDPRRPPVCPPVCFTTTDRWEYLDAAWLSRDDAPAFARTGTISPPSPLSPFSPFSPPTLAALRALGWLP